MFIVLEGIDGAGKGRQRLEIVKYFKSKNIEIDGSEFPDHNSVFYKELIKPTLMEKLTLNKEVLFLSFALDQLMYKERIIKAKNSKTYHFICDGYFTTNIVYQVLLGKKFTLTKTLNFAKEWGLIEADLNIFIDVDPKIAVYRKSKEKGHEEGLDANEKDEEKQQKIRKCYFKIIKEKIMGEWNVVDGNGNIGEVRNNIVKLLNKYIYERV